MQEEVGKAFQRLSLEQRRQGREDIFARNRRYLEMTQRTNNYILGRFMFKLPQEKRNKNLIEALICKRYDRTRIMEYVGLLWHEEMVRVYEGLTALAIFGEQVVNVHTEEEFLGSGVVQRLLTLAHTPDHPFVQQKCFQVLQQIALAITKRNLETHFNLATIPLTFFIEMVRLPDRAFMVMIEFLQALYNRSKFIDPINENIPLLEQINDSITACFTSNEGKGKTVEIAADLNRFSRLLNTIKVYLYPRCIKFTIRYYQIKRRIASYFIREHLSQKIQSQLGCAEDKQTVKLITNVIKLKITSAQVIIDYVRDLIEAGIQAGIMGTYAFRCVSCDLIYTKETRHLFSYKQLFGHVENTIRADFGDQKWHISLKGWMIIIIDLLDQGEQDFFEIFLSKRSIFSFFAKQYEITQHEGLIKSFNNLVRGLITQSSYQGVTETLCRHDFIKKYFKSTCRLKAFDIWNEFRSFTIALSDLKKQDTQQYETIRRIVVIDEDIYAIIDEEKDYIVSSYKDQVLNFYKDLREEERVKQAEVNHMQEQAIKMSGQSEVRAGQISRGGKQVCNRCLRRHAQR